MCIRDREKSLLKLGLADILYREGKYKESLEMDYQVLELRKTAFGEKHVSSSTLYRKLSSSYQMLGDIDKATEYSKLNLEVTIKHFGPNSIKTAVPIFNLGIQYDNKGMYEEAEEHILRAIGILNKLDDKNLRLGYFYSGLGIMYINAKEYQKSVNALLKSKSLVLLNHDENTFRMHRINVMLALAYSSLEDFDEAEKLLDLSYETFYKALPDNMPGKHEFEELYDEVYGRKP